MDDGQTRLGSARIALLGPRVMAGATVSGLIGRAGMPPDHLTLSGPRPERLEELRLRHVVKTASDNREAASQADVVVMSVKPQTLAGVLAEIRGAMADDAVGLSIVAGARLNDLVQGTGHAAWVRSIPNTRGRSAPGSR